MKITDLKTSSHQESYAFYISFADLMMLLSVFFLMLLAMSKVEVGLFEQVRSSISGSTKGTLVDLAKNLDAMVKGEPGIPGVKVRMARDGVRLDLDTATLFDTGSAKLKPRALVSIRPLFKKIIKTPYVLDVEGHTDDVALYRLEDGEIESNWSLSGRRAAVVINELSKLGFAKKRLRVVGYADTKPIAGIKGKRGRALNAARAQNRRVSILVR